MDPECHARPRALLAHPGLPGALEAAAAAIARLDQALDGHPLLPAFLHRARLDAVRRQAGADGHAIDPWHLAAALEGLRLRMDAAPRIVDRGAILDAARAALGHHQWLTAPDLDQQAQVQTALRHLAGSTSPSTLLGAALRLRSWLDAGGPRPPVRAALVRHWVRHGLLRAPVPLTGAGALAAGAAGEPAQWARTFLHALAAEARDCHQLLRDLERGWLGARAAVAGRRSTSRAPLAVDVLAAAPLLSATTLARALGMSVKGATATLDGFVAQGVAVEVTHRSARRLFGLQGMAPVRDATTAPRRPQPGRGRGRPPHASQPEAGDTPASPPAPPPPARFERPAVDYAALEAAMAHCEQAIRASKRALDAIARGAAQPPGQDAP